MLPEADLDHARRLLCRLQDAILAHVGAAQERETTKTLSGVAEVTVADTIYAIDKVSEEAILAFFEEHWPRHWPVEVVMEGLEEHGPVTFPKGTAVTDTRFKCILDPIDGTREIMHDKRSAWALAGLAPQRGTATTIAEIQVAAMTELPPTKQDWADQLSAVRGRGLVAERFHRRTGERKPVVLRPLQSTDVRHGFATFTRFFPGGKSFLCEVEETFWQEVYGEALPPVIFEDQYITTGGQFYEIIAGHDHFVADLRPPLFEKLGLRKTLVCHPYDVAAALLMAEAGAIVEKPDGSPLDAPLDTTTPVTWVAFSNAALAERLRPILRRVLARFLGTP